MLRTLFAALVGIVVCTVVIGAMQSLNLHWFPAPAGMDFHDPKQVAAHVATLPAAAFAVVLASWLIGSFVGGAVATRLSPQRSRRAGLAPGVFTLIGVVMNIVLYPHPLWMAVLGLLLPIPAAWLGHRFMRGGAAS